MTPNKIDLLGGSMKDEPWKHYRRAISTHAIDYWVGWEKILSLHKKALEIDKDHFRQDHSLYFVTIFETGGRVSEIILLRPEQIRWNDSTIKITRMRVHKQRRATKVRNVFIKIKDNPLAQTFIDHVKACDTKYLLPGYGPSIEPSPLNRFRRKINPNRHISTTHVYKKITAIDPDIWPHWLRDQRSWHLSAEIEQGGSGFDAYELKEWFGWTSMDMPAQYAGRRGEKDILRKLGIEDVKEVVT